MSQNKFLNTIVQQHYSSIYELDLEKQSVVEYSVSSMEQLETMLYDEWLHQMIAQLQFVQIKPFSEQMQLKKILAELEDDSVYIVEYQNMQENRAKYYQMVFCYADLEKRHVIITQQNITKYKQEQYEHIVELEKDSARFRFTSAIFAKILEKSMLLQAIRG